MGKINVGRVFVGGLIAGVILNIGEWIINGLIMAGAWSGWMADHMFPTDGGTGAMIYYIISMFVIGIFTIWVYSAIRPRYGAGWLTAICAGLTVWFAAVFFPWFGMAAGGMFPFGMTLGYIFMALIEYLIAAYFGAWYYREEVTSAAPAAEPPAGE